MHTFETATPSPLPALRSSYPSILPWTINLVMHYTNANPTYTWPGSKWRPSACEADVIATRPQVLVTNKIAQTIVVLDIEQTAFCTHRPVALVIGLLVWIRKSRVPFSSHYLQQTSPLTAHTA